MDKLVKQLGINSLSKSQFSRMAADLDEQVEAFRHRPLGEAGPVINAVVLVVTGVNGDGHREVLRMRVATAEERRYLGLDLLNRCRLNPVTTTGTEVDTDPVLELSA